MNMKNQQKGFTLIELIMVIVILGILSAFALPRFADFGSSAREATLDGGIGAVRSAAGIARSQWLVDGDSPTTVDLDGSDIVMSSQGFPVVDSGALGIREAAQLSEDFQGTADDSDTTITFSLQTDCEFTYSQVTGAVSDKDVDGC